MSITVQELIDALNRESNKSKKVKIGYFDDEYNMDRTESISKIKFNNEIILGGTYYETTNQR